MTLGIVKNNLLLRIFSFEKIGYQLFKFAALYPYLLHRDNLFKALLSYETSKEW